MKLLIIGSDRNLFKKNSDVWNRYLDYGKLFEEIYIIVFSARKFGNKNIKIGDNVFVYPTNHIFKFLYLWNVYKVSKSVIVNCKLKIENSRHEFVVTSQDPFEAGLAGWMIKKICKIPLQIQVHTDFLSPYFWREALMNKTRVLLAKFVISRADGIRVVSERIKWSLIQLSTFNFQLLNIDILPIFVDVELIKSALIKEDLHKKYPQFDFIILMASRLSKEKNIGMAIEAFAELIKKHPKLGLIICGKGPELGNLEFKIKNLKLHNSVVLKGWSGDLVSYYKTADLYLLTSNYEGYGRSVVEAMAAGLPVVMSDVGLAGEVVKDGESGLVFAVGDKKAMIASIESLILDKNKRDRLGINAIKAVEILITKEEYLRLYKKIIEPIKL